MKGEGNQQDYGMRVYDPRIGRFLSVDPLKAKYPELTPYQFASNNPIAGIDLDGKEFLGFGYIVDELSKGASKLGLQRTAGFISSYGHSVVFDPVYSAHNVVKTADAGDMVGTAKQFDPTGISGIPDIYQTGKKAVQGDAYAQGQILGMLPALYGGYRTARSGGATKEMAGSKEALGSKIIGASEGPVDLGGGRVFNHFTDAEGIQGIAGVSSQELGALKAGDRLVVNELKFGTGSTDFLTRSGTSGEIFVTELGPAASEGQLARVGVFKSTGKQQYTISFSEEAAFNQNARVRASDPNKNIYTIPANAQMKGTFTITRNY